MHYATHCVSPCLALLGKHAEQRGLPRLGADRREVDPQVWQQPVRHRDGHLQDPRLGRLRRGHAQPVQRRPASIARASTPTATRRASSGNRSRARSRSSTPEGLRSPKIPSARPACPTSPVSASRTDPAIHDQGRVRGSEERDSTSRSPRAAATAARTPTLSTPGCPPSRANAPPCPDAETSANWTMVGICAHESALKGGARVDIPGF